MLEVQDRVGDALLAPQRGLGSKAEWSWVRSEGQGGLGLLRIGAPNQHG